MTVIDMPQTSWLEVKSLTIRWDRDDYHEYGFGDLPITKDAERTGYREYGTTVDVRNNIDAEMKIGGCTREQALVNTARELDRIRRWHNDDWAFVGCVVKAVYGLTNAALRGLPDVVERLVENDEVVASVWGIESDCGKDYKKEIESDEFSEVRHLLEQAGCEFTDESWAALVAGAKESNESHYISEPPSETGIDPIPDDEGKWWFVDNYNDTRLYGECRFCSFKEEMPDNRFAADHCPDCLRMADGEYFEEPEEQDIEEATRGN